jgi:hypothetical protein
VLPLSTNPRLDPELGTRHRAAIGITEETDAVVIVVSEERGAISLCVNGNIIRDLDAASLREALLGLFFRAQKRQKESTGKTRTDERARASEAPPAPAALAPNRVEKAEES